MTRISDLSQDLIEEILSRVPLTSQRAARSTCKQWNGLYRDESFTKKHRGKAATDTMGIMVCNSSWACNVCLVRFDLEGVHNNRDGLVELTTKLGKIKQFNVSKVYHCDGLLLCIPEYSRVKPNLVVLNPYLGQVRRIKPRTQTFIHFDRYCIGYDNNHNHKILRILHHDDRTIECEIYDFKSDSWRALYVTCDWTIPGYRKDTSLKGNTYFVARERLRVREYLICFDFTSERFRHCLDLESSSRNGDSVILSSVGEEQLAVLSHRVDTHEIEIRITTKIEEANEMTWRSFLKVDVKLPGFSGMFWKFLQHGSFFVDEDKKAALIYDNPFRRVYMIGENNYFKVVPRESTRWEHMCSYVPSSVQIKKGPVHVGDKRKLRD